MNNPSRVFIVLNGIAAIDFQLTLILQTACVCTMKPK